MFDKTLERIFNKLITNYSCKINKSDCFNLIMLIANE